MPSAITAPVDCKRFECQSIVDSIVATGNVNAFRGTTPPGLPPGGYWEYRKRADKGRMYITYNLFAKSVVPGRCYVIASVDPEYAQAAVAWKPQPYAEQRFDFASGSVLVRYDAQALPANILALEVQT